MGIPLTYMLGEFVSQLRLPLDFQHAIVGTGL